MLEHHPFADGHPAAAGKGTAGGTAGGGGWIDLWDPSAEELRRVANDCHVEVPSREALQEIETSSRLRAEGQKLYLSMPLGIRDAARGLTPMPLGFVLTPSLLISVRYGPLHAIDTVVTQLQGRPAAGSAAVFSALVEAMVDFSADLLEQIAIDLASVSVRTFGHRPHTSGPGSARVTGHEATGRFGHSALSRTLRESLRAVGATGDHLSLIRESLLGLQRITRYVQESAVWMPDDPKGRLAGAQQDLASLVDFESHLSGKTQFMLDAVLGFINTEQNDIFKVLTIVSVVGIPPTLIASMYGMNFRHMPELNWHWGYPYGLALIALSTLLPIVWFKRRGWW
jgi:magnesium transporter